MVYKTPEQIEQRKEVRPVKVGEVDPTDPFDEPETPPAGDHVLTAVPATSHLEPGSSGHGVMSEATLKAASSRVPKLGKRTRV